MINVTKTFLPPIDSYIDYLRKIWDLNQLTNNGPLVQELELKLKDYLDVRHLFFVSNGTIALQIAIKALDLHGEIITSPFSYVATTSSIVWENCEPVFADIDPHTLCIDPEKIEAAITPRTSGIIATHVYGIPCDVEKIEEIAGRHGIKVLYDAAHTFGGKYKGRSIVSYGDISTLSFHATKLFHTVEGGAIITDDDDLAHRISYMRNFGHKGQEDFWGMGINGKNSEFHAAMGLCTLPFVAEIVASRKRVSLLYDELLRESKFVFPIQPEGTEYNYSYYPIIIKNETLLISLKEKFNNMGVFPRRYFYPSLDQLPYIHCKKNLISNDISKRVLCLPLYSELDFNSIKMITNVLLEIN